jgi:hypothetical protein
MGTVKRNPFVECALCPVQEQTPSHFTAEDFEKLLSFVSSRSLRDIVLFAVLTGMRRDSELALE